MSSIGIKLPLAYSSLDGFHMIKTIRQMAKQNFKMLILTNPGERIMEPNFGVGLSRFLFENNTKGIKQRINDQVSTYMPAIQLVSVDLFQNPDSNLLNISISYKIPSVGINDLLEFTI
jgi:phage baseplate assembly protein W|tara:strand:+ start:481 stop:834 length:354 start_codon:yes stop_codon:yes gene_type:complete